jgi:hypothetical protein
LIRMAISPLLAMSTELSAAVLGIDEDDAEERNRGTGLRERRLARRERMATGLLQDLGGWDLILSGEGGAEKKRSSRGPGNAIN